MIVFSKDRENLGRAADQNLSGADADRAFKNHG
jgi:hypothetical protein